LKEEIRGSEEEQEEEEDEVKQEEGEEVKEEAATQTLMLISATHWREETTGLENRTVHF
jgi:hypothetical protein